MRHTVATDLGDDVVMGFPRFTMFSREVVRPLARRVKRWLYKILPYRPDPTTPEDFEIQYARGQLASPISKASVNWRTIALLSAIATI